MKYASFVKYANLLTIVIVLAGTAGAQVSVLDHFWCYPFDSPQSPIQATVQLFDPLTAVSELTFSVTPTDFCNRVQKTVNGVVTPIVNVNHHFVKYSITPPVGIGTPQTTINNQFGVQSYTLVGGGTMLAPAGQGLPTPPPSPDLDHYECYGALSPPLLNIPVTLQDDFTAGVVTVQSLSYFCNPVAKTHGRTHTIIQHLQTHLACYGTSPVVFNGRVNTLDQFSNLQLSTKAPNVLCVPSTVKTWMNGGGGGGG